MLAGAVVGEVVLMAGDCYRDRTVSTARLISERRGVLELPLGP